MATFNALNAYLALEREDRIRFLLHFGYRLTVVARYFYVPGTETLESPGAVRAVNEIQHQVFAQAIAHLGDDCRRYPDEVFIAIVMEDIPDHGELRNLVQQAFADAIYDTRRAVATA
jgi:hypothetical protein